MTREQHLNKILAKLDSLIALAKKRTPGRWIQELEDVWLYEGDEMGARCISDCHSHHTRDSKQAKANATFIASCAGNAEAGWVSMRDEIASLKKIFNSGPGEISWDMVEYAKNRTNSIIAAWPEEML